MKCAILFITFATLNCCTAKEAFTLDDFLNSKISNRGWNGSWITGDTFLYVSNNDYYIYNLKSQSGKLFMKGDLLAKYNSPSIYPSQNLQYVLIEHNVTKVFRHSKTAQYDIYSTKKIEPIAKGKHLQYCKWVAKTTTALYVLDNNLYHLNNPESVNTPIPLSTNGVPGQVYNGVPDWVYEEEVLSSGSALWTAPNGSVVIFAEFDDSEVSTFSYIKYGEPGVETKRYPQVVQIKYPKVNEINPKFKLYHHDLVTYRKREVSFLNTGEKPENFILYGVVWNVTHFFVQYTDRYQTHGFLKKCEGEKCVAYESYKGEANGWFSVSLPVFSGKSPYAAQIKPNNKFRKLHVYNEKLNFVDEEATDVVKIYGIDGNTVYYAAAVKGSHWQQHVYSLTVPSKKKECLSCNFSIPNEGFCKYASVQFSPDMSHYVKMCQGPGPNYIKLERTLQGGPSIQWEDNSAARLTLSKKLLPVVRDVAIAMNGYNISARLLLPPNIDKKKKYPMIVNVYAGPNSNQISDVFKAGFEKFAVTNMSYIYTFIDGRGSGRRGLDLMYGVYKQLGTSEIEDQITATEKLQSMYSFIDKTKTGIWGWSYGGFATAWVLAKDTKNVFKCGISVAPVTNFELYDSIYSERYMDAYNANKAGYNATDLTRVPEKFRGKNFFLIHGNADDNVHYQQSMLLARALELADVPFKQTSYPEETHALKHVYPYLYHSIIQHWQDSFQDNTRSGVESINTVSSFLMFFNVLLLSNCI